MEPQCNAERKCTQRLPYCRTEQQPPMDRATDNLTRSRGFAQGYDPDFSRSFPLKSALHADRGGDQGAVNSGDGWTGRVSFRRSSSSVRSGSSRVWPLTTRAQQPPAGIRSFVFCIAESLSKTVHVVSS